MVKGIVVELIVVEYVAKGEREREVQRWGWVWQGEMIKVIQCGYGNSLLI